MKISLINPPFLFPRKEEFIFSQCIGLRSLSSYLKTKGNYDVHFIDALKEGFSNIRPYANGYIVGLDFEDLIARIPAGTDLIGVSAPFSQLAPVVHEIVGLAKRRFPDALVAMGGVYPSTQPQLALTSEADFIVVGEGESALLEIAGGKDPKEIDGVYIHESNRNEWFPPARLIDDLDSLPFPDYSIPSMDRYFKISPRKEKGRVASLFTSRGCPFDCEFCSIHPVYGKKYRFRSAGNVLEEIRYLVKRYGIRSLEIEDDNFTLKRSRTAEILEGIVHVNEEGAGLNWRTPNGVRIDTLDQEIIELIVKSNCTEIVLALEHGDPEMLQIMNKQLDLDKAFSVIEQLIRYRIPKIGLFVIVGYPEETSERFLKGLNYLKKVRGLGGNIWISVNIAQPYPGTKLLTRCWREGYITDKHFDNFLVRKDLMSTTHTVWITTPDFDAQKVLRRKDLLEECFDHTAKWRTVVKKLLPPKAVNMVRSIRSSLSSGWF
jgi:anaerobic magnesium-protoporphyrin IX monomethyl ester cyclase